MTWEFNIQALPILLLLPPLAFLAALVYQRNQSRAAWIYAAFTLVVSGMVIATSLVYFSGDDFTRSWMEKLNVAVINLVPVSVFYLFSEITGFRWLVRGWRGPLLVALPVIGSIAALTNQYHGLYWKLNADGGAIVGSPNAETAIIEVFTTYYIYLLMLGTIMMMVDGWRRQPGNQRRQYYYLGTAVLFPVLVDLSSMLDIVDWGEVYPTPYAISVSVVLLGISMIQYRFMDMLGLAQGKLFSGMQDAVIVASTSGEFYAANPSAQELFKDLSLSNQGRSLIELLPESLDPLLSTDKVSYVEFVKEEDDSSAYFDVSRSVLLKKNGSPTGFVLNFRNITRRKRMEANLVKALGEKDLLLREVHHRVKNNFNLVASLLSLQSQRRDDPEFQAAFQESRNRILSMAQVHEALYRSEDLAELDLGEYLGSIAADLVETSQSTERKVRLELDMTRMKIGIEQAIPCGLILNEIITNSIKYGGGEEALVVSVSLRQTDQLNVHLEVADNGPGLPADAIQGDSLGLKLIHLLTEEQLGGKLEIQGDKGTRFVIEFLIASPIS